MYKILFVLFVVIASCSEDANNDQGHTQDDPILEVNSEWLDNSEKEKPSSNKTDSAKNWLTEAIDKHFNQGVNDFSLITTDEYYGYKIDVINSNFSHGIDLDSIKNKWSHKYEVSQDDIDVGFLIDAQDNGKIEIESCVLRNSSRNSILLFSVSLYDTLFKSHYKSDITVIPYNGSYAIDDVKENFKKN